MSMLAPIGTSLLLSGACYIATKGCEYLCTRPVYEGRVPTLFDRFREKCCDFQESFTALVGERQWESFCTVVIDNAWVSTFVLALFCQWVQDYDWVKLALTLPLFYMSWGAISFSARCCISRNLRDVNPAISEWISPSFRRHNLRF